MKNSVTSKTVSPVNREAFSLLEKGLVHLERKNFKAAKAKFLAALELEPEYAAAYFYLGNIFFEEDFLSEAIAAFEKSLEIDPTNDDLRDLVRDIKELP